MSKKHLQPVRRLCAALPETTEKLSHGEPIFFVRKNDRINKMMKRTIGCAN